MVTETQSLESSTDEKALVGGGALAGLAALVSASCCILPLVLVNIGAGSALASNLSVLTPFRPWLIVLTVVLVVAGFAVVTRRGQRPTRAMGALSGVAVTLALAALVVPVFEEGILAWLS